MTFLIVLAILLPASWLMQRYFKHVHDRRWVRWFGHRWPILPASFLLAGLISAGASLPWIAAGTIPALVGIAWFIAGDIHDSHICDECIAAWPANAPERAEKQRGWLWLRHGLWKVALPFIGLEILAGRLLPALLGPAILATIWALGLKSRRIHDTLAPWCPYCGPDDGGDNDTEDAPTPDDDHYRPVPSGSNR